MKTAPAARTFGATSVPWTVSWSGEDRDYRVEVDPVAGGRAICQHVAPGYGKPLFSRPHWQRQREAIIRGLCDLCGRELRDSTKVSLSHARSRANAHTPMDIIQAEPLLHKSCAMVSMRFCPSLKRDLAAGTLNVFQVFTWRAQCAIIAPQFLVHYVPDFQAKPTDRILGHAKVQLVRFRFRTPEWLECGS